MPENSLYTLTAHDAAAIKRALVEAAGRGVFAEATTGKVFAMPAAEPPIRAPIALAQGLVEAFAWLDQSTQRAAS